MRHLLSEPYAKSAQPFELLIPPSVHTCTAQNAESQKMVKETSRAAVAWTLTNRWVRCQRGTIARYMNAGMDIQVCISKLASSLEFGGEELVAY